MKWKEEKPSLGQGGSQVRERHSLKFGISVALSRSAGYIVLTTGNSLGEGMVLGTESQCSLGSDRFLSDCRMRGSCTGEIEPLWSS